MSLLISMVLLWCELSNRLQVSMSPRNASQGRGVSVNSPASGSSEFEINGQPTTEAILSITAALENASLGKTAVSYKLRNWIFSRQWYWGEPFPLATHPDGHAVETPLPVILPEMEDFKPRDLR